LSPERNSRKSGTGQQQPNLKVSNVLTGGAPSAAFTIGRHKNILISRVPWKLTQSWIVARGLIAEQKCEHGESFNRSVALKIKCGDFQSDVKFFVMILTPSIGLFYGGSDKAGSLSKYE
jgi:hypothetical protein